MRPWSYVVAVVAALVAGAWLMRGYDAARTAQARIDTLTVHVRTTDTLYRTDTLYFARKLKVAVAVRDTVLLHLTDTVLVKQFIAASDTAIRACQSVVLTCERRVAQRDSLIAVYKSLKPSRVGIGVGGTCGAGFKGFDCVAGFTVSVALWH